MSSEMNVQSLASVITTLTLANNLLLHELARRDPAAARHVARSLQGYAGYIDRKHGADSADAKSTRSTVQMLTNGLDTSGEEPGA